MLQRLPSPLRRRSRFRGILPADFRQLGSGKTGIHFNRAQRVGRFDCTMLPDVTGEDDATAVRLHVIEELKHLFRAELACLIDNLPRLPAHHFRVRNSLTVCAPSKPSRVKSIAC